MKFTTRYLCCSVCLAVVTISSQVGAAEFTCEANQRNCLYDSVVAANQTKGPDTIRFTKGYHFIDRLDSPDCTPPIVGDLTIVGAGRIDTQLHAGETCAFFRVPAGSSLTLRDILLGGGHQNGSRAEVGEVQRGAAVYNEGRFRAERTYFISNDVINNDASLSGGGAVYNAPQGKAFLTDTEFHDNQVGLKNYGGAAILNEGTMTIKRSRFLENSGRGGIIVNGIPGSSAAASLVISDTVIENNEGTGIKNDANLFVERTTIRDGDGVEGGGIYNGGEMTVRESALIRNRAIKGGGVYSAKGAKSTFINTTISLNHARGKVEGNGVGGGIYNFGGTVYLASSTIASNTSQGWGAAIAATSDADGYAFVYTKSSLIVGHSGMSPCFDFGPNDLPKLFLVENNLITEESNCYAPSNTDIVVKEATVFTEVLSSLSDHGSPTPGYALLPGSPAIDRDDNLCTDFDGMPIVVDQRGKARTGCDRGAIDSTAKIAPVKLQLLLAKDQAGVQPDSTGTLIVVMLSRADSTDPFEPLWDVERSSLRLGSAGATPFKFTRLDLNKDGIADLVMRFKISEIGIACKEKSVKLQGTFVKGAEFTASAPIKTTNCKPN